MQESGATSLRERRVLYAQQLIETGQFDKAASLYLKMTADDPADVVALLKLGDLQFKLRRESKALSAYERGAEQYCRSGQLAKAITVYQRMQRIIRRQTPHMRRCFQHTALRLAEIYIQLDQREAAMDLLARSPEVRAEPEGAKLAAQLSLERGDKQGAVAALADLRVCFRANPTDFTTTMLLVRAFEQIDEPAKAYAVLKESVRIAWERGERAAFKQLVEQLLWRAPSHTSIIDEDVLGDKTPLICWDDDTLVQPATEDDTVVDIPVIDESIVYLPD